jgi:hypothetical protein
MEEGKGIGEWVDGRGRGVGALLIYEYKGRGNS